MRRSVCLIIDDRPLDFFDHAMLQNIDIEKHRLIQRYRHAIDQRLSLYADLLVRSFACEDLNIQNEVVHFAQGDHKKPFLKDAHHWHFNVSHTYNAIAVCTADRDIGVDIEASALNVEEVAERCFTVGELAYARCCRAESPGRFAHVWTRKEAYIKWTGEGLRDPLSSFDTLVGEVSSLIHTFVVDQYTVSVCSLSDGFGVAPVLMSMQEFYQRCMTYLFA